MLLGGLCIYFLLVVVVGKVVFHEVSVLSMDEWRERLWRLYLYLWIFPLRHAEWSAKSVSLQRDGKYIMADLTRDRSSLALTYWRAYHLHSSYT